MQLINIDSSPYAARIRAQIYLKNLDIEIIEPDPPLGSAAFKEKYALGKLPILKLGGDDYLSESWVIMNYLEDLYPEPSLRPADARARADMGLFQAFADQHLRDRLYPIFMLLFDPSTQVDPKTAIEGIKQDLAKFDKLLKALPDFQQRPIHLGDIAAVTSMYFAFSVTAVFGVTDMLGACPRVSAWWDWVQASPQIKKTTNELDSAFKAMASK